MSDDQQRIERRKLSPELQVIHARLDDGDSKFEQLGRAIAANTDLTMQVVRNTSGLVAFSDDLATGSRFLCRCVKGVQFVLKDVVDPYWKPALICFVAVYLLMHHGSLPDWLSGLIHIFVG